MTVCLSRGRIAGFDTVILESPFVRVSVIPRLGARVWELEDRLRGRQWVWHREGVPLTAAPRGAPYDDVWAGGWEELFPNDALGVFEGRTLLDHGEWWTSSWTVTEVTEGAEGVVRLTADEPLRGARCVKELRVGADRAEVVVSYRIENTDDEGFHFLFKQHLPVAITPRCRLALPRGTVKAVDPSFGTLLPAAGPFAWPRAGEVDLAAVPERSSTSREFVYVTGMAEPWCGVDDLAQRASLRMHYEPATVPFVWLFLSYGGWRDCYTAVLEPCTNMPKDLAEAVRLGQSAHLDPRGTFETSVRVSLGGLS